MKNKNQNQSIITLSRSEEGRIFEEAQIILESYTLLRDQDGALFVRFLFRQYAEKTLTALSVDAVGFDVWGKETEKLEGVQFLDLYANDRTEFGQTVPVALTNPETRVLSLTVRSCAYDDGSLLSPDDGGAPLPAKKELETVLPDADCLAQYRKETVASARYAPFELGGVRLCACGSYYRAALESCPVCGVSFEKAVSFLSEETLRELVAKQKDADEKKREKRRQLEEEARIRTEQAQKELDEAMRLKKEEDEKRKKKKRNRIVIISVSSAAVLALTLSSVFFFIPLIRYRIAASALENGDFDAAITGFSAIPTFGDAAEQKLEATYQKAAASAAAADYKAAKELYDSLGDYKDSKTQAKTCGVEADYQEAVGLLESKDYEKAAGIFDRISGEKKEAGENGKKAHYLFAEACFAKTDYLNAEKHYEKAGTYSDAADKKTEAAYQYAVQCFDKEEYENAYTRFSEIGTAYKDVATRLPDAAIRYGVQLIEKKEWEKAIGILEPVASHADGTARLNEAKYGYVQSHKKADDSKTQSYLYDLIKYSYKDSYAIFVQLYPELAPKQQTPQVRSGGGYTTGLYRITPKVGVNIRSAPSAGSAKIGSYNVNNVVTVLEVRGNWGRTDRGWICLDYAVKTSEQAPPVYTYSGYPTGYYVITERSGLNIRSAPGSGSPKVGVYLYNNVVYVYNVSGNWGQTDRGWICLDYASPR